MDRLSSYLLSAGVAAIGLNFSVGAAAADRVEHVATQTEPTLTYAQAVREAEQQHGPHSETVIAPLVALADALARSGHHKDAVPPLQRAIAIMRSQYGVFDVRQQDALKALANSLVAIDRVSEAQEQLIYRAHVAEKTYGEGSPKIIPVLCDLGDFFSETGKAPEAHVTFNAALSIVGAGDSMTDPIIVEPLRGIARTYMRKMSYPEAWLRPRSPPGCFNLGQECRPPFPHDSDGHLIVEPRELNPEGERALQRALQIVHADPSASTPQTRIETLLQMGDWHQINKSPREALPYYQRAWQLIHTTPDLPDSVTNALNVPLRVYYPTPAIVAHVPMQAAEVRSHYVQVEFSIAADGSVSGARIVDHDTRDRYARDVLQAVRASRFRPRFIDGQAVATPRIAYREVFFTAKPRK